MNVPLRRVAVVMLAMFLVLMGAASWIQYFRAPDLNTDPRNVRTLYREHGNNRGPIVIGGEAVAVSTPVDDAFGYQRAYTNGPLYAPVTGFYSVVNGRTQIELRANEYLNGTSDSLWWSRLQNLIAGADPQGSSVELTIDPVVQQAAWDALGDQRGAVVALDPTTGAILAMVSKPSYDPNLLAGHVSSDASAAYQALLAEDGDPLINRAIGGNTYPPGSTFKLVTAAAALEEGDLTSTSEVAAPDELPLPQSSSVLGNFGGETCSSTGTMTLADALRISCNTAFGQLGIDLGSETIAEQAEEFGFDTDLSIPTFVTQSRFPQEADGSPLDDATTALSAIGQASVRVTPLQVAMVSAAIANDGKLMTPYLIDQVRTPDLAVAFETDPSVFSKPISSSTAEQLRDMMVGVVQSGTGTAAQISGVQVAGKTGTAETTSDVAPHAWFTGFAPADDPQVVVAVVIENGGNLGSEATGGRAAAPVARAVMEAVINQ
ncbi:peptidoglycan D,D-transpeptidase FtsI family protein [Sanguibacter antarcticus]|uniref:Cell elongation-specific peptidoglycan D,D-transpeptidase n=1 Tax=Sanguibacter antarcticus TaxID=372484 RepID=A0A2A9E6S0_9MICO|nr:penicillin-binding transpeptidase domain-containing protein [Sanguibacter antarcticus]PFG34757.1 cell elongation-specific peptidoglycan D,D-transpeptidase [Sanguibacter antarcticus]